MQPVQEGVVPARQDLVSLLSGDDSDDMQEALRIFGLGGGRWDTKNSNVRGWIDFLESMLTGVPTGWPTVWKKWSNPDLRGPAEPRRHCRKAVKVARWSDNQTLVGNAGSILAQAASMKHDVFSDRKPSRDKTWTGHWHYIGVHPAYRQIHGKFGYTAGSNPIDRPKGQKLSVRYLLPARDQQEMDAKVKRERRHLTFIEGDDETYLGPPELLIPVYMENRK